MTVDTGYAFDPVDWTDVLSVSGSSAGMSGGLAPYVEPGFSFLAVGSLPQVGPLASITPVPGLVDPDPAVARWTPIVATIHANGEPPPYVFASIGTFNWCVFDPTQISGTNAGFLPMFTERSSATLADDIWTISILPNGGWWRSGITLRFVAGSEL